MPIQQLRSTKQYKIGSNLREGYSNKQAFLLSSCPPWIFLMVSSLWVIQAGPLRAMDPEKPGHPSIKLGAQKSLVNPNRFYKDSKHPQTGKFWKTKGLSERLEKIKPHVREIQEKLTNYKTNSIHINTEDLIRYKNTLRCIQSDAPIVQSLPDITYANLLLNSDDSKKRTGGWSGAEVIVLDGISPQIKIVIKKFKNIHAGLEELLYSLIALDINPSPKEIKMARIWDAALSSENSTKCLNIIMECANGQDIHDVLSTHFSENAINFSTDFSSNAIKACAQYLAIFHIRNYQKLRYDINREKHLSYAAKPFNTLIHNPLKEKEDENKPKIESFPLVVKKPLSEIEEPLTEFEQIKSDNVLRLLSPDEQEKFIFFAKNSCDQFERNSSELYRSIQRWHTEEAKSYFLTITHGDAHGNNFFYDNSPQLLDGHQNSISEDSFYRVTMIDFASIIKTYGDIGDPAEDVGRFLGSLWDWAAKQDGDLSKYYEKIWALQEQFIQSYMKKIKENSIFTKNNQKNFEKIFKENYNFYKLRFYRIIANAKKDQNPEKDKDIKLKILRSWIQENTQLASSMPQIIQEDIFKEGSKDRPWTPVCTNQKDIFHLPDRSIEFIESATEETNKSYLTLLWEELHRTGIATLSSKAAIAGMGGVGKTSLALEYAHEALKNRAYNLIYWVPCGTELSLLKAYRDLLVEMNVSHQGKTNEEIIELFIKNTSAKDRYLLIYDNVPDATFLKDKIPQQKAHMLMTSRSNEGWDQSLINLNVFCEHDSIKYFSKVTGLKLTSENKGIIGALAKELGHLPLALSHAAHYIKLIGGTNVSGELFKKYLEDFRQEPATHFERQRNLFKEPESEITYNNLIERTLHMSRKLLSEKVDQNIIELAEKLMAYSAYLDPDAIAEEIFLECSENKNDLQKALAQLSSLSLIKAQGQSFFSMHRLVQLMMRTEQESKEHQPIQVAFLPIVSIFNKLFKNNISPESDINKLLIYFPHILNVIEHSKRLDIFYQAVESLEWIGKILCFIFIGSEKTRLYKKENINKISKMQVLVKLSEKPDILIEWILQFADKSHPIIQRTLAHIYADVKKDYIQAFLWFQKAAEQRDADAQLSLGVMYERGEGAGQNDAKAVECYSKAAKQGDIEALRRLGDMYIRGKGVSQSYKKAFKCYTIAAEQGYPDAYFSLGLMYHAGQGVDQNYAQAAKYYKKADKQKNAAAQFNLGLLYDFGDGVGQNFDEAFKWYKKAAKQGRADAQLNLGGMYEKGKGVPQNYARAFKWYKKAAEQGHAGAQNNLGAMYLKGQGVSQNYDEAFKWFTMSTEQEIPDAQCSLGMMYHAGQGVPQNYAKALEWYRKAAKKGHPDAQAYLGIKYAKGQWVPQSYDKALKWFRKAAEQGHAVAQYNLGVIYDKGKGLPQSYDEALLWYKKAAEQGMADAQYNIGLIYLLGRGVPQNYSDAFKWFQKAAEQGDAAAQYSVGVMYDKGQGVVQSDAKVLEWYKKAAEQGNASAQYNVGIMYAEGQGVVKSDLEAFNWFKKAAEQGHAGARAILKRVGLVF